jgi:hypothetical protein
MSIFNKVFWIIWGLIMIFLVAVFVKDKIIDMGLLSLLFILSGINLYVQESRKKMIKKLITMVDRIDFKPIEDGIRKIDRSNAECYTRLFRIENDIENYKLDQEKKYRDVVRKVLNIDNEFHTKFRILGETVIKISKKFENGS